MTTFATERTLAADVSTVFRCIQDAATLARWWGPAGFTNRFERFEFAPAGHWDFDMIGPDGKVYANRAVFARIEIDRQVVVRHVSAPEFTLTITLEPLAAGTRVCWAQAFDDDAVANALRHIVEPANEQNLDRLAALLGQDAAATR